jgi:hypothetical protein
MSAGSAKRWARSLLFVWLGMWLSMALLPCGEAVAAVKYEQAGHIDCGCPADAAPDSGSGSMTGACLVVAAPVRAPAEELAAPLCARFSQQAQGISASFNISPPRPVLAKTLRPTFSAAPPLIAVYLRNSRLLI